MSDASSAPSTGPPTEAAAPQARRRRVTAEEVTRVVLAVLAARTGYEPDMIEDDMALETGLGVDSIKREKIVLESCLELNVYYATGVLKINNGAQDVAALFQAQASLERRSEIELPSGTFSHQARVIEPSPG